MQYNILRCRVYILPIFFRQKNLRLNNQRCACFAGGQLSSYVLTDFSDDENDLLSEINKKSNFLINEFIEGGFDAMMIANSKLFNNHSSTKIN